MQLISIFNNKGGVGKTTLTFHTAHALALQNKKVLLMDLDPQCNLSVTCLSPDEIYNIWKDEDESIDDISAARTELGRRKFSRLSSETRSCHFLLKPAEDGTEDLPEFPPPKEITKNLFLIPGRLSLFQYESRISRRWSELFQGDPLAIRTVLNIRTLAEEYANRYNFDYVILDTSPSLGDLNKVIISTVDGFIVPAMPDMFSLYGIRNIGNALQQWKSEFDSLFQLLPSSKRKRFPNKFVRFLGYCIYNAKKYTRESRKKGNEWDLAKANYFYASQIPDTIKRYFRPDIWSHLNDTELRMPIGNKSIMHTHNTMPNQAQKYRRPMWELPYLEGIEKEDIPSIIPNRGVYEATQGSYVNFVSDLEERVKKLG